MDVDQNRAEQVRLYGEPLGELLSRYAAALALSQARLADLLGLSAPMLSQLMNARRVRIGNPAAVRRLQAMHDIVAEVQSGQMSVDDAVEALRSAKDEGGDVFTKTTITRPHEIADTIRALLHAHASAEDFERAARVLEVDHEPVAKVLHALGGSDSSAAHALIVETQAGSR